MLALDRESADWVRHLTANGDDHRATVARLHALLLGVARGEAARQCQTSILR